MDFSKSMKNHGLIFHPIAVLGMLESINGSDIDIGAHEFQKLRSKGSRSFMNKLILVMNQQLRFYMVAVFDLLKISNCLCLIFKASQ